MEERADAVEGFTPEMIGHAFVTQFYYILRQNPGLGHRFFQDTSSMTRPAPDGSVTTVTTMKASPIQIGGHKVYVEEKRSTTRVINGVTTLLSGRGGYCSNGFQGRGNFSGGHGYGRNYYERRANHGNMTCNGEGYHRGYQNWGGRAIRQGGPMQ